MLTKEDVHQILSIKGEIRGIMSHMADAVREKGGRDELKKVEELLKKLEYPMPYSELSKIRFYKIGKILLYLMAIREVLGWQEKEFKEMGRIVGKNLIIFKLLSPFLKISKDFVFKDMPRISRKYIKDLKIIPLKADIKKKVVIFKVKGMQADKESKAIREAKKTAFSYLEGLTASWAQMMLGSESVQCKIQPESDYEFKFIITW